MEVKSQCTWVHGRPWLTELSPTQHSVLFYSCLRVLSTFDGVFCGLFNMTTKSYGCIFAGLTKRLVLKTVVLHFTAVGGSKREKNDPKLSSVTSTSQTGQILCESFFTFYHAL